MIKKRIYVELTPEEEGLKDELKVAVAKKKTTIKDLLLNFIKKYINEVVYDGRKLDNDRGDQGA